MPKVKISEYSATANSNTDVASINIDEGCAPSGINNAIRAIMGHLKDFQSGTNGDPFNGPVNGTVGATTPATGAFTTLSATGNVTLGDASTDTLNVGNGGLVKDASGRLSINQSSSIFGAQFELTGNSSGQAVGIHGRSADGLANIVFGANGGATEYARIQSDNTSSLQFGAGSTGATKMTLNSNGVLALSGASTSATGVGITFPATQSASSNANTLDDYEEGTWTPTITAYAGSITAYTSQGSYVKIGRIVFATVYAVVSNAGTASGAYIISNLPFSLATSAEVYGYGVNLLTNAGLVAYGSGTTNLYCFTYSGAFPGGSGTYVTLNFNYSI